MSRPVDIISRIPAGTDEYGNVTYVETAVASTYCFLSPLTESEIQGGTAQVGVFLLVLHSATASQVDGYTVFVVDGHRYEAIGPPAEPASLVNTGIHHVEFMVQRSDA